MLVQCAVAGLHAQSYSFRHFTVNDGLPSNETYAIYQGKTGELYIGTEYGLVQYDGEYFDQVPFEDYRYSGSMVFEIKRDENQRIWIRTYRDGFFYLDNDTLRAFRGNAIINAIIEESYIHQFYVDSLNNIWFTLGNTQDTIFRIDAKGQHLQKICVNEPGVNAQQFIYQINTKSFLTVRSKLKKEPFKEQGFIADVGKGFGVIPPAKYAEIGLLRSGYFIDRPTYFWLSMRNIMLHWDKIAHKMMSYELKEEIISANEDKLGNILIGTRNGAYFYSEKSLGLQTLFENRLVSGICQDNEGGYWFTTNSGLIYLPSIEVFVIPKQELDGAYISAIAGSDSLIATAGSDKYIRIFKTNTPQLQFFGKHQRQRISPPKTILFNNEKLLYEWSYLNIRNWKESPLYHASFGVILDIEINKDNTLLAFKKGFLALPSKQDFSEEPSPLYSELFCRAIYQSGETIYVGTDRGVFVYTKTAKLKPCFPATLRFSVSDIKGTPNGEVIITTRAGGVFILSNDSIYQISMEQGLSSPFCTRILVENDSTFWVGTNRGLNRILWDKSNPKNPRIDNWYAEDGLASDKINDLARSGKFLFSLTDEGINYFDLNNISVSRPNIRIEMVKANIKGRKPSLDSVIELFPDERDIWFEFRVFGFKKRRNTQMMYTLSGNEQYLSQTGGQTILYRNLLPGEYKLEVTALAPNGAVVGEPKVYTIFIEPYFYETVIFKIILSALLITLLAAGVIAYLRRLEGKRRRIWEFGNAQLEALNLQMNPHFLFNALNNIQYLSFSKDHKMLNRFVSGLSGLMRSILILSKNNLIPLETALKNIEQYLELEMMRIEDETFSYEIIVDKELDIQREFIPPMLIQPLVENAIWHGLLPKRGSKALKISFIKNRKGYSIEVLDNGVGINQAKDIQAKEGIAIKPSLGLHNITRRLQLYESMGFGSAKINIEDMSGQMNGEQGTRVTISFMLSQKHISSNAA